MYATDLIGKRVVRSKPCVVSDTIQDYSYMNEPVLIVNATDCHVVFRDEEFERIFPDGGKRVRLLDCRWCDNNWVDYDDLLIPASEKFAEVTFATDSEMKKDGDYEWDGSTNS